MTQQDLYQAARRQPFRPFQVMLSNGEAYAVRHPQLIMVGRDSAIIGLTKNPESTAFDRGTVRIDLLHIVAIQELPVQPPSPSGPVA